MEAGHETGRFTLWAVLGIAATVATTVAGGTWLLSRTYIEDELEQYRRSAEWKLPDNLKQLGELSKQLNITLAERKELEGLRAQSKALQEQAASLQSNLRAAEDSVAMLTKGVGELEGLRAQSKVLQEQTASLQSKLKAAEDSVAMLTKRVGELEGDTFEVPISEAHFIVPGRLAIGVKDTSTVFNTAEIQFGKDSLQAKPGTPFEATIDNATYTVTLLKIGSRSCTFAVSV